MVRFHRRDILMDPPDGEYDFILCRNLLIYLDRPGQEAVLERFARCLRPGGFLVLGRTEVFVGASREAFEVVDPRERIYRRLRGGEPAFSAGEARAPSAASQGEVMRAKLVLSFLLVILSIVAVNATFYYVLAQRVPAPGASIHDRRDRRGDRSGLLRLASITAGISNLAAVTRRCRRRPDQGGLNPRGPGADRARGGLPDDARTAAHGREPDADQRRNAQRFGGGISATTRQMSTSGEEIASATELIAEGGGGAGSR